MSILRPMMRPIMRPMIRSVFRGSAFDPLSLFANGEQGAWHDPSDLTTLYQDSAGTTPVAVDGDPVGLMLDKSGNGNHASQAVAASRPTYRTDGTLHWLEFDGVDDFLVAQYAILLQQPAILSVAYEFLSGSSRVLVSGFTTANRHQISSDANSNLIVFAGTSLDSGVNAPLVKSIISGVFNGSNSEARVNGIGTTGNAGTLPSDGLSIGAVSNGTAASQGMFYGLIHVENDGGSIPEIEAYLAQKAGVTL